MFRRFHYNVPHYFSKHPDKKLIELFLQFGIMDLAIAAITIFEPIYLYTLGYSLRQILLFYILIYGFYLLLAPLGGRFVLRFGAEKSIFLSSFFLIFYYLSLFFLPRSPIFFLIAALMFACQKTFYWVGYHYDFYKSCCRQDLGKDVGTIWSLDALVYMIGPVLGGAVVGFWGYNTLFLIVAGMILFSNLPLYFSKTKPIEDGISYQTIYSMIFDKNYYKHALAFLGFGEELIVMVLWPIFIYLLIHNYFEIGGIISLATFITSMVILIIGKMADQTKKTTLLQHGVVIYFVAWLIRGFVRTPLQVLGVDTLSRLSKNTLFVPLEAMVYEDAKVHPLRYLIFYEISLSLGKLLAAFLIYLLLFLIADWAIIFTIAGCFCLLYLFYCSK